jgi:hypothetical protein
MRQSCGPPTGDVGPRANRQEVVKRLAQPISEAVVDLSVRTNANTSQFCSPEAYDNHRIEKSWSRAADKTDGDYFD